jgi:hypothetical protein
MNIEGLNHLCPSRSASPSKRLSHHNAHVKPFETLVTSFPGEKF